MTSTSGTAATNVLTATGVWWNDRAAELGLADPHGHERSQTLAPGRVVAWRVHGPRRCTGIWIPATATRRPCPGAAVLDGVNPSGQCPACTELDPGRLLARDGLVDDRLYQVYLAWFGPGLVKIGITAVDRGQDRLSEQGALLFTWLARGRHLGVRRIETTTARAGHARERLTSPAKRAGWARATDTDTAIEDLRQAHASVTTQLTGDLQDSSHLQPFDVHDLRPRYGLTPDLLLPTRQVTAIGDGSLVTGTLTAVIGSDAVLTMDGDPMLMSLRLLSGWGLTPTPDHTPSAHLTTRALPQAPGGDHGNDTLF